MQCMKTTQLIQLQMRVLTPVARFSARNTPVLTYFVRP